MIEEPTNVTLPQLVHSCIRGFFATVYFRRIPVAKDSEHLIMSTNPTEVSIFHVIENVIVIIVNFVLFVAAIYKSYCTNSDQSMYICVLWTVIMHHILNVGWFTLYLVGTLVYDQWMISTHTLSYKVLSILYGINITLCVFVTYVHYISRLYYTFNYSIFKIHKYTLYGHIVIACCSILFLAAGLVNLSIVNTKQQRFIIAATLFIFLLGYTQMVYILNRNLFLMVLQQRQTLLSPKSRQNVLNGDVPMNTRQIGLLQVITKITLLTSINVFFFLLTIILTGIAAVTDGDHTTFLYQQCVYLWTFVQSINLSLMMAMNKSMYGMLCKCCDSKCGKLCESLAQKRLLVRYESSFNSYTRL